MAKRGKATQAEMTLRVRAVVKLLRKGFTRNMIQQYAARKWGITDRPIDEILSRARNAIQKEFEKDIPHAAKEIVASLDEIYRKALVPVPKIYEGSPISFVNRATGKFEYIVERDLSNARMAIMDKAKLLGLLKNHIQVSGSLETGFETLSDDELDNEWTDKDS
jgi:hypothetical protein